MICENCDNVIELHDHKEIADAVLALLKVHGGLPGILLIDELAVHGWTLAKIVSPGGRVVTTLPDAGPEETAWCNRRRA
jgi:hypothetical protein